MSEYKYTPKRTPIAMVSVCPSSSPSSCIATTMPMHTRSETRPIQRQRTGSDTETPVLNVDIRVGFSGIYEPSQLVRTTPRKSRKHKTSKYSEVQRVLFQEEEEELPANEPIQTSTQLQVQGRQRQGSMS
jgi:hypothetical protein